jgi:hypothetical protein
VADLQVYRFPARPATGLLFGLSLPRLLTVGAAGVVLIAVASRPTVTTMVAGGVLLAVLAGAAAAKVGGRTPVDWLPVWAAWGWVVATGNREFYASPDLDAGLPDGMLDLPGGLFGLELHTFTVGSRATVGNPTPAAGYGVLIDTFRDRMVTVAEVSGQDLLFCDPQVQQARFAGWGQLLDHLGQSLPELCRLQLVHLAGPATSAGAVRWHQTHGGRGTGATATSYRQVLTAATAGAQQHRLLLAVALDRAAARRAVRQAGGGHDGAAAVLLDRAAIIEDALTSAGVTVHGWLPARALAGVLRAGFDPAAAGMLDGRPDDVVDGGGTDPALAGPTGMVESWTSVRLDSGWAATLQVVGPPSRPVTGEFLQHLLIGVPATRRLSLLYIPTPAQTAERRAQARQVTVESEQALRARWGFSASARHRREHGDAARHEADLVDGRTVYRLVWTITVLADTPTELDASVGQVEAAARRCSLELRRLVGTQRQAAAFTLPLCRGAR